MSTDEDPVTSRPDASATGGLDPDPPDPGAVAGSGPCLRTLAPHAALVLGLLLAPIFARGDALLLAVTSLLLASAWAAWLLARLDARHRTIAWGLVAMAACALLREGLRVTVLHGGPYVGAARVVFHLEEATRLATAALPAWMALRSLTKAKMWIWNGLIVSSAGGLFCMLVVMYPWARGDVLRKVYLGAELATLFVTIVAIVSWGRRAWALRDHLDADPEQMMAIDKTRRDTGASCMPRWYTYGTVLALVAGDLTLLIWGAWRWGLFGDAYVVQQGGLIAVWGMVAAIQGAALALTRRGR